jgi:predicted permease
VIGARVSAEFCPLLGPQPILGRLLLSPRLDREDEQAVVIGRRLWAGRFGASRDVLGQRLRIDGNVHTIVGVLPSDFGFPARAELWLAQSPGAFATDRATLSAVARLKAGVSLEQARAELRVLSEARERQDPKTNAGRIGTAFSIRAAAQGAGSGFWLLLGAVGAALLVACANVASLSLVRALARERETAVRAALGADQWRLALPSLVEGILVAVAGAAGGGVLGLWGKGLATAALHRVYDYPVPLTLSPVVLGAGFVLALVIGAGVGIVPVVHLWRMDPQQALREGAVTTTAGRRAGRLRQFLVIGEIATALVLLTGAGLLTASFLRIQHYDLGYDADHVLVASLSLAKERQADLRLMQLAAEQVVERTRLATGAQVATWSESYPRATVRSLSAPFDDVMALDGRSTTLTAAAVPPYAYHVSPAFFDVIGVRLVKGRGFTATDDARSEAVAIVNETAARLWWPGEDPLGKRFRLGRADTPEPWLTVVGVAANTHTIGGGGAYGAVSGEPGYFPLLFGPLAQGATPRSYWLGLRGRRPTTALATAVRRAAEDVDPGIRVDQLVTLRDLTTGDVRFTPVEFNAKLLTGLAVFGLFLALVGVYGLVADVVRRRTREIGIRIALGARDRDIVAVVMNDGLRIAAMGVSVGLLGSYWLTDALRSLLFGMSPTNPAVFAIVCAALGLAVLVASYLPARRAVRVDPMVALRTE